MISDILRQVSMFLMAFSVSLLQGQNFYSYSMAEHCAAKQQIFLLKNTDNILPITELDKKTFTYMASGNNGVFLETLRLYADFTETSTGINHLKKQLLVVFLNEKNDFSWKNTTSDSIILVGSFKAIGQLSSESISKVAAIVALENANCLTETYAAELLFGGGTVANVLSQNVHPFFPKGTGLVSRIPDRLGFSVPAIFNLDSEEINTRVAAIMGEGIEKKAFPGAQLLVAKKGKIIYHKTFGYHTYQKQIPVQKTDVYDLASVTKIAGPLPAIMQLVDQQKLDLDKPFSTYWRRWSTIKNKKNLTLREILAHQAGLAPYIIFLNTIKRKNGKLKSRYIRSEKSKKYNLQAYDKLFVSSKLVKKIYKKISKSKVSPDKTYKYSGLSFLLYPKLIADISGQKYQEYLQNNFYNPLGAYTLGYTPLLHLKNRTIVPTEMDTVFRKELVHNWVHDENAALMGGVSGNAGLFSSATDLAKLMQMYLQKGTYGYKKYLNKETVEEFTKIQYPKNNNRRGLGFDKPLIGNRELEIKDAYPAPQVSENSFGHAGFTGTFVWVDPDQKLVFVFLSNRVNPTRNNRNLYTLNIRPRLQEIFYTATLDE